MNSEQKLRIVHVVRAPIGGIFRHIVDLALAQSAAGHEVGIICDSNSGGPFEASIIAGVEGRLSFGVSRFPMRRQLSLGDLRATAGLLSSLRALRPDVIHGHGAKGGAYARLIGTALRMTGRKVLRIYCPHGGSLHYDAGTAEGQTYFRLERFLERLTDGFVFVSGYEENSYRTKVGATRRAICRVYNGLWPAEFEPIDPTPAMADLVCAGMVRDLKGQRVLVRAMPILAERHGLRPTLRIVGDGPDRESIAAEATALGLDGQVTFHDPMPTRTALSQGRILVVPSLAESMPYIVLEALAARLPVVATRVGGVPEIFGTRADRLIPAGDPVALADAIAGMLADEDAARKDAMVFGREIAGRFSTLGMADEVGGFYLDLIDPRHRSAPAPRQAASLSALVADQVADRRT